MKKVLFFVSILFFSLDVWASGKATIKNIKVNGIECSCNGYECSVEVNAKTAKVTYELDDINAKVERLSGFTVDLESQTTLVKIVVTNDSDNEKVENTYNLNINLHEKNNDYTLRSLRVNNEDIPLLDDVFVYSYDAKYAADTISIEAITNDVNAKIQSELEFDFPLDKSSISCDFDVLAENGEVKTYRIVVKRGVKPDTLLKSLKLDKGNILFDKNTFEYNLTVEYNVNDLIIEAIPNSPDATVQIEKEDLVVGENTIKVIVTNDKATSEYILSVTREPNMDKSLANLKTLKVLEYPKLNFEENVLDYVLKFDEIPDKLTITASAISSDGKVDIINNENLKDNSKVIIKVTLIETGITREYSLEIIKNEVVSNSKTFILISIIVLVITTIVLFILELKDKKNKRKMKLTKILELKKKKEKEKKISKKEVKRETKKDDDIEII